MGTVTRQSQCARGSWMEQDCGGLGSGNIHGWYHGSSSHYRGANTLSAGPGSLHLHRSRIGMQGHVDQAKCWQYSECSWQATRHLFTGFFFNSTVLPQTTPHQKNKNYDFRPQLSPTQLNRFNFKRIFFVCLGFFKIKVTISIPVLKIASGKGYHNWD